MDAPRLRDVQDAFWRAIATAPGTSTPTRTLLALATAGPSLDAAARLQVYADAYFLRLRDVLVEDFPRVASILGSRRFDALARDYLSLHPSTCPSVRGLGDRLAEYLAVRGDVAPWLADLARLERARVDAFDAPDCRPLGAAALAAVPAESWPGLRFVPNPSLAVLRLDWPAHEPWRHGGAVPDAPAPTVLRVWRGRDHRVFHAVLRPRAAAALELLLAGAPFGELCGAFADLAAAEAARQAGAALARWIGDGLVARCVVDESWSGRTASQHA